jgi:hypothetical protein
LTQPVVLATSVTSQTSLERTCEFTAIGRWK